MCLGVDFHHMPSVLVFHNFAKLFHDFMQLNCFLSCDILMIIYVSSRPFNVCFALMTIALN